MNKKKIFLWVTSLIIAMILMIIPNNVKATNLTNQVYFGVQEFRQGTTPENMGYAIFNPYANGTGSNIVGAKLWQIVKYNNGTGTGNYTTGNYYCVRAGVGFSDTSLVAQYTTSYDMKTERDAIRSSINTWLQNLANNSNYNNLLALTDLLYLQGDTSNQRAALIAAAGISEPDETEYRLTDSDISAVQQAAIWYFTNNDQSAFDNYNKDLWLFYRTLAMSQNNEPYTSLEDYARTRNAFGGQTGAGIMRNEQAVQLYRYLIDTAKTNSASYANGTATPKTKVTLYTNESVQNTQPIIEIERKQETVKEFDLALRKYITKVDGTQVSDTRVPNIDQSTIATTNTATYKHRKDPVVVTTGKVVTYNLTVYNEGEKAGRATKIIDQLPAGLTLRTIGQVTSSKGNVYSIAYDSTNNRVTFTTTGTNNLNAYSSGNLDSDTIEIECTVTETASTTSDKVLTNIAWISEEYDAVDNVTITNQQAKDRDSEPSTAPNANKDNMQNYIGTSENNNLTNSNYYYKGGQDDDDFEKLILEKQNENSYNVFLVKEDANGEQLNSQATFIVNGETKTVVGKLEIASNVIINSENVNTPDTYVIKETIPPDEYCEFDGTINITVTKKYENNTYKVDKVTYTVTDPDGKDITENKTANVYVNESGNIYVEVKNYQFDLKLIKRIAQVNATQVPERIQNIDITKLANGTETTADYRLNKNPVSVKKGDIVKYTFRVYNEGQIDGYAAELTEDIPEGLEFLWSEKTVDELNADTNLSTMEKEAIKYNQVIWDIKTIDSQTHKVEMITTDYLAKGKGEEVTTDGANLIKAFDSTKQYKNTINDKNPDYREVSVFLRVTSSEGGKIIRNEAEISKSTDASGKVAKDRDSDTNIWRKYEDDEDYDNIILQTFDLALRKFIIAVSEDTNIENSDYLKNSDGSYKRAPIVDTSKLNTTDENGKLITTAIYNHTKTPVSVEKDNIVVYMIRVYNEADISGYASEITDHLPSYLEFVNGDFNTRYGWEVSEDGRTVKTNHLNNQLISGVTTNSAGKQVVSYREVPIMCKVKDNAKKGVKITNIADITECKDENKNVIEDRDSEVNNVVLPSESNLPSYKDNETGDYIPGQQDDDDFEKVVIPEESKFDLALRKFITGVNEKEVTNRIPEVKYDTVKNKFTYEHTKEPVDVITGDVVVYTIRVYNEGEISGFASEISDDIPAGLKFLPDAEINKEFRWVLDEKNNKIATDYLSKEQGEARMKNNAELTSNPALLKAFDGTSLSYADVQVAFEVVEPNTSEKVIVNSAQISDDSDGNGNPVKDIDSTPDKWIDGEDDQDREYIKLQYFDLSLRKWVTHAIVIENGKQTVTQTGHKAEDNPEQVVKVELDRKKLSSLQVKFKYSIRITNEGQIAGYAKEITDYIPEGLKFVATDNPDWKDEGNNVISTRKLENKLLQPGESAEVEVTLTWINGTNTLGLKTNIAEISEDYNDRKVPDIDSIVNNKKAGEDDIDDAPVILSIKTGSAPIYITLGISILAIIAGGVILIKKYVL